MSRKTITTADIAAFAAHLRAAEKSPATVAKYTRAAKGFAAFLNGAPWNFARAVAYKRQLGAAGLGTHSVKGAVAALNALFAFFGAWRGTAENAPPATKGLPPAGKGTDKNGVRAALSGGRHKG